MPDYDKPGTATNRLGDDFWVQKTDAFSEPIALIYASLVAEMRREGNGDAIEAMLIERVAYLYCYIREAESADSFESSRAYKETLQLFAAMSQDLRKSRDKEQVLNTFKEKVLNEIAGKVTEVLKTLPKAQAGALSVAMADALDNL